MLTLICDMDNSTVFIDAGYLSKLLKIKSMKIDFIKLSNVLTTGTQRIQTLYYDALPIQGTLKGNELYRKAQKFHSKLNTLDKFQVKLGRLQPTNGNFIQKGVDMRLGIDLVQMSMKGDIKKAILVTGDSDFEYAVEKAQEAGAKVALAYFPISNINLEFKQAMDELIVLEDSLLLGCRL